MKKLIIFLLLTMFSIVSCGDSKKTENDSDLLPDEDVPDVDENDEDTYEPDEELNDTDEESGDSEEYDNDTDILPDEDVPDVDENDEDNEEEPDESADTDEENPCDPNPCEGKEYATGECIIDEWDNSITCVCDGNHYWNGWKCTNECEGNPCQYEEHAIADSCSLFDTPTAYECDCEEGYHWAYFDCEKDYEEN